MNTRRGWQTVRTRFTAFLVLAVLNVAGPVALIALAIAGLNASIAAILNATTPIFTVVVAGLWLGTRVTWRLVVGVVLGVAGVVGLLGDAPIDLGVASLASAASSLSAALLYAVGAVYARRTFWDVDPRTIALGQLVAGTAVLIPFTVAATLVAPPPGPFTGLAVVAILIVGIGGTAGGSCSTFGSSGLPDLCLPPP